MADKPVTPLPDGFEIVADAQAAASLELPPGFEVVSSPTEPSVMESIARGMGGGATLEFGDDVGLLDRKKQNVAKKANPWSYTLGSILGGTVPMVALGPLGVGARLGSAGRVISSATTPTASATWTGALGQGAKAGSVWGGLYGAGSADPSADASTAEAIKARLTGAATGGIEGALLGGPLNVAIHGGTRAVGAIADKVMPGLREGAEFARDPANAGLRQVLTDARRDMVNFDDVLARMTPKARGTSIAQRDIDKIVDLHTKGLPVSDIATQVGRSDATVRNWVNRYQKDIGRDFEGQSILETLKTPTQRGQVVTTKNLDDLAQYAANSPGEGQNLTRQAMLQRKADQPSVVTEAVDRIFRTGDIEAYRDAITQQGAKTFSNLYGQLHASGNVAPWPTISNLPPRVVNDPMFRVAMDRAQARARLEGSIPETATFGDVFHPGVVDYMQRILRQMGEGPGFEAQHARAMRTQFLGTVDQHLQGFPDLRQAYRAHMARQEMLDAGQTFNLAGAAKPGSRDAEALKELRQWQAISANRKASAEQRAQADAILDAFKRGIGQSIKDMFDSGRNPMTGGTASALNKLQARNVERRLRDILPKAEADEVLAILDRERRKIDTGQALYGNSKTEQRQRKSASMEAVTDIASGIGTLRLGKILRGTGDIFSDKLREQRANRINQSFAETDMNAVRRMVMMLRDMDRNQRAAQTYIGGTSRAVLPQSIGTAISKIEGKE